MERRGRVRSRDFMRLLKPPDQISFRKFDNSGAERANKRLRGSAHPALARRGRYGDWSGYGGLRMTLLANRHRHGPERGVCLFVGNRCLVAWRCLDERGHLKGVPITG